ncbi:uncharacterized protein LOC132280029 [Cornus florida]|uniref:uncharacterized protein LOC132280029 n=1 Tax=Cornus florida TaxID=4283 RepID=UPI0028970D2B|nr:uncharacterized protein LOC132280029 [Cornus florida]
MLDGLLGRGFSSKCKSLIKMMRTRIDVIRRNKDARQRIMKKDIADLLANGLVTNAFIRTEEFFAGLCLLFCYDFIEQSCEYILKQLSIMQKQRECPEECREAVSSLMFAAARFSDLPELRDLRDTFQDRYGNSLEYYVNQKFVEKLASNPPTMEKKLQLLQDIALEFSVKWDCRGYEQILTTAPAFTEDQPGKYGPSHVIDDRHKLPNGKDKIPRAHKRDLSSKERDELGNNKQMMRNGMEFTSNGVKPLASREEPPIPNRDNTVYTVRAGSSSRGARREFIDGGYQHHNNKVHISPGRDSQDPPSHGKPLAAVCSEALPIKREDKDVSSSSHNHVGQQSIASSTKKVQEDKTDRVKSFYNNAPPPPYIRSEDNGIPSPYTKPKGSKYGSNKGSKDSSFYCGEASIDPSSHNKEKAVNGSERIRMESEQPNHEGKFVGPARVNSHCHEKDPSCQDDIPLPKPRSVRRKHSKKSSSTRNDLGNFGDSGVGKGSSSRRRDNSRRGLQILFEDEHHHKDEDERVLDKLLLHFSKKPSIYEPGKVGKRSKDHPSHQIATNAALQNSSRDGPVAEPEMVAPPTRSISLPREQTAPSEAKNVFARTNSFQPGNQARHVHPKLPDYDDLAKRFAALRGR